jgi:hypothetical protein
LRPVEQAIDIGGRHGISRFHRGVNEHGYVAKRQKNYQSCCSRQQGIAFKLLVVHGVIQRPVFATKKRQNRPYKIIDALFINHYFLKIWWNGFYKPLLPRTQLGLRQNPRIIIGAKPAAVGTVANITG